MLVDKHIAWADVAVHRAVFFGDGEDVRDVGDDLQRHAHGQRTILDDIRNTYTGWCALVGEDLTIIPCLTGVVPAHVDCSFVSIDTMSVRIRGRLETCLERRPDLASIRAAAEGPHHLSNEEPHEALFSITQSPTLVGVRREDLCHS